MVSEDIDDLVDKLEENSDFIWLGLDKKIIWALNSSNNFLSLVVNNQSVSINIHWNTMFLYEIKAKWFWANLMLQILKKAIDDWLQFIKIEAKPLGEFNNKDDYKRIEKYLSSFYSSFWFKRDWNTKFFTLNLDDEYLINILNNKFDMYLNKNIWIKL